MKKFSQFILESYDSDIQDVSHWHEEQHTQQGSNSGGIHYDENSVKHYVKVYNNPEHAKTELASAKIHHLLGVRTVMPKLIRKNGKVGLASVYNDDLKVESPYFYDRLNPKQKEDITKMYHAAIITNNRDIVGLEHDNIMVDKNTGDLHSIDQGGSFSFRAQGARKEFSSDNIDEKQSLRKYRPAADVFNSNLSKEDELKNIEKIKQVKDSDIRDAVKSSGLTNHEEISNTLIERKNKLINSY